MGTCMVSTNMCTNIISFTLLQAFEHRIQYLTPIHSYNPVQIHRITYTNASQTQIWYKLDDARKNIKDNFTEMPRA